LEVLAQASKVEHPLISAVVAVLVIMVAVAVATQSMILRILLAEEAVALRM
jgi:Flp pilus assembly pilin Flp